MTFNTAFIRLTTTTAILASALAFSGFAAPGTISQLPLVGQTTTPGNLMIFLDNSTSMNVATPYTPYNAATAYGPCPTANYIETYVKNNMGSGTLDATKPLTLNMIKIPPTGSPSSKVLTYDIGYFKTGSSAINIMSIVASNFGYTSGKVCFNPTVTYTATSGITTLSNTNFNTPYTGNYLNWVLVNNVANFSSCPNNSVQKCSTVATSRWTVANNVWHNMVNTQLTNVNVGIVTIRDKTTSTPHGANIMLAPINVTTGQATLNALYPQVTAPGSPIASSMAQIGQYFTTAMPTGADISTTTAGTLFNITPAFSAGVSTASPITAGCQKNFLLIISDGQTNIDDQTPQSISTGLQTNYTGPASGNWIPNVAKALYETDLAPNLNDNQGNAVVNNIRTYTISYGADSTTTSGSLSMQDAAKVGGGLYANAIDGTALEQVVAAMAVSIMSQLASGTGIAFNSTSLQTDSALYTASYQTGDAIGDLKKVTVNATTGAVSATPTWSFQTILQGTAPSSRLLFTNTNGNTATLFTSANFTNLTTAQKNDLNQGPSAADGLGTARVDYLRGGSNSSFRNRQAILGDIVHSSPIYVGAPISGLYPGDTTYTTFVSANANRQAMVYAGDNSGVFHAINATTGAEVFGYLPLNLFSNASGAGYHYLTDPNYVHRYYIDGPYGVGDAYLNSAWQTVLVSGQGAGGKGYFALNVTNPSNFTSSNISNIFKWEFSSSTSADLGYTFSKPVIGKMNDDNWYVIFGNGYNSTNGIAKLFLVKLTGPTGAGGAWTLGTDYYVLTTGSGSSGNPDGLSSPAAVDTNADGKIDRIYAGSVQGTMWSFNVSSTSPGSWGSGVALINTGQPITGAPLVTTHPTVTTSGSNTPNLMVFFGTGQYVTNSDPTDATTRGLYGVWDNGGTTATTAQLVTQTFTTSGTQRTVSNNTVDYNTKRGWTMVLTGGERSIEQPALGNTTVFFATMKPQGASSTPCTTNNGLGWLLAVDAGTGSAGTSGTQVLDASGDGSVTAADKASGSVVVGMQFTAGYPNAFGFLNNSIYAPLSDGSISKVVVDIGSSTDPTGRISVQELRPPGS